MADIHIYIDLKKLTDTMKKIGEHPHLVRGVERQLRATENRK